MRPTPFGIKSLAFYFLVVVAFYATPYSNPFFLLLGFLTLLGAVGAADAVRNLRGVEAELGDLRPMPAGSRGRVRATLTAPGRPRHQVGARLVLAGGHTLLGRVDLLEGRAELVLEGAPLPRGLYRPERATVETTHPFGLVRVERPVATPQELVVFPAPSGALEGRTAAQAVEELLGHGAPGSGELQPSGLRDHREGEELRGVHWRASARRGRLVVQEWEGGSGRGLEVVLDRRCAPSELEEALAVLSALVALARAGKETLRLHSQELSATFGENQRPWAEALRFLAAARTVPANGPAPPAVSPSVVRLPRTGASAGRVPA